MSPVSVELWLMRIFCGLPMCVRTMNGSKQTCWAPGVGQVGVLGLMVVLAASVPHQLLVAVTAEPGTATWLTRLLVPATWDRLPAKRLKLMVAGLPAAPIKMPPPKPVPAPAVPEALFPVIVTLVSVALSPALPLLT